MEGPEKRPYGAEGIDEGEDETPSPVCEGPLWAAWGDD